MRALRSSCYLPDWLRPTRVPAFVTIRLLLSPCICVHSSRVPLCACVSRSAAAVAFGRLVRESSASNRCGSSNTLRARSLLVKLDDASCLRSFHGILRYIDTLGDEHQSAVLKTHLFYFYICEYNGFQFLLFKFLGIVCAIRTVYIK